MGIEKAVDKILDGVAIQEALNKPVVNEGTVYDEKWEQDVHKAAKDVFASCKKLWDLMVFAPEKYYHKECQDALNAYSAWYQKFVSMREE